MCKSGKIQKTCVTVSESHSHRIQFLGNLFFNKFLAKLNTTTPSDIKTIYAPGRSRTYNFCVRSAAPYPLDHGGFLNFIKIIVLRQAVLDKTSAEPSQMLPKFTERIEKNKDFR